MMSRLGLVFVFASLGVLIMAPAALAKRADAAEAPPACPPIPSIQSIQVQPESFTLTDGRDVRRVLVVGIAQDGQRFDLSDDAKFSTDAAVVTVDADHYLIPHAAGSATVTVQALGKSATIPVKVLSAEQPPVRYVREVMPTMSKAGCNAGACHGSLNGKNGFKLSLRGYDPEFDYNALVNELQGRRIDRVQPERSLMLLKPTAAVPHEGRQVIRPGSRQYELIDRWIKEGAKSEPLAARATSVEVLPPTIALDLPGRSQHVIVLAHYADGSVRDVTRDAILSSNNEDVAKLDGSRVIAYRRGEGAVQIRYEGNYGVANVAVMGDRAGFAAAPMPENNFIDKAVNAKLARQKIQSSELCTDADFVRRLYLDLTGTVPSGSVARAFVEDKTPSQQKRERLADQLMGNSDFVAFWSNKWADLLQCNSKTLGENGVWVFREWIRQSVAQDKPYDQFVRELITAEGSSATNPAVNYFRTLRETGKITEDVSQTFLGVRFNCNKCHDHPFERWTQEQYYQFGAFFARVAFKPGASADEEVVFNNYNGGEVVHPKTARAVEPVVPYGAQPSINNARSRQGAFADWLVSRDNPYFARSYANRVWSYFFGRGIIDPVDDIRASNPPVNPELLDALTRDFVSSKFDVRHLIKAIVTSRTYQLSVKSNTWNADDRINFSHALPRRLTAEQMMDAVAMVTGVRERVPGLPDNMRSVYLADGMTSDGAGNDFLKLFGRPKRETACECERTTNVSLAHALSLINGPMISDAVTDGGNQLARLVAAQPDNRKVIEEMYYSILNRPPTEAELASIDLGTGPHRLEVTQDLAWALLNSPAFLFNR